jgi:hypothetical protein
MAHAAQIAPKSLKGQCALMDRISTGAPLIKNLRTSMGVKCRSARVRRPGFASSRGSGNPADIARLCQTAANLFRFGRRKADGYQNRLGVDSGFLKRLDRNSPLPDCRRRLFQPALCVLPRLTNNMLRIELHRRKKRMHLSTLVRHPGQATPAHAPIRNAARYCDASHNDEHRERGSIGC